MKRRPATVDINFLPNVDELEESRIFGMERRASVGLNRKQEKMNHMPVVRVSMLEGRTKEQKAELAKTITKALADIAKTKPESVFVIFEDVKKEDWASGGNLMG